MNLLLKRSMLPNHPTRIDFWLPFLCVVPVICEGIVPDAMDRFVDSAGSNWSGRLASPFRQYWVPEYNQWHSPSTMDPLSSWPKVKTSTRWYDWRCPHVNVASTCTLVRHSQIVRFVDTRRPRRSTRTKFIFISCKAKQPINFLNAQRISNLSMKDKRSID